MLAPDYEALIFDLDGTLWEASHLVAQAWTRALRERGESRLISSDDIRGVTGQPQETCVKLLFPQVQGEDFQILYQHLDRCEQQELASAGGILYPGVEEGLARLQSKYALYLVSNCQTWYLQSFWDHTPLKKYFQGAACFGDAQLPKWRNIQNIMTEHSINRALYLGDTLSDQMACQRVPVDFFFCSYGFARYAPGKVDQFVAQAKDFPDLVHQLMSIE